MWHEVIDMVKGTGNYTPEKIAKRREEEEERKKITEEIVKLNK
ncbi:hypothetical protein [Fusobacterium polymorphum]|jgi:hypothetical protein|nr:MAG TPA: hypothetical protein [Caudoviricetes sp.]